MRERRARGGHVDYLGILSLVVSNASPLQPGSPGFNYLPQIVTGQKQGLGMIYGAIQAQAAMLSFNDINRLLTVRWSC
ncbi:MAG: hypothetical protein IVW56_09295 [Candidatus Binataceae bacterium]|nr:hypothetical protein [Candidatus Binataceae bacterium]